FLRDQCRYTYGDSKGLISSYPIRIKNKVQPIIRCNTALACVIRLKGSVILKAKRFVEKFDVMLKLLIE
ncbi:unnamed protein product, partial [Heterotrigona itama]